MPSPQSQDKRAFLLSLYNKAVATAQPETCIPQNLPQLPTDGRLVIVGAGKATAAMAVAAERHYKTLGQLNDISGLVTTRYGYEMPTEKLELTLASHPVPDDGSIAAAARALEIAGSAGKKDLVVCLLSGGASALWTAPVDGVTLAEKQELTKQLLRSGATISEINCVRKHLSQIKGGRLAAASYPAKLLTLAISDVAGDNPDAIGSGPTVADTTTLEDARVVIAKYGLTPSLAVSAALANSDNETLKQGDAALASCEYKIIAAASASLTAAAELAATAGYEIEILSDAIEGEARDVARHHAELARAAHSKGRRVAILSGGELTVTINGTGRGGPNQEYALALALALDGAPGITGLAGDTDGTDGGRGAADDPAGALVFPDTLVQAGAANLNAANFLENNDSTGFFQILGDLIECGPTQTNVNDFRVILVDP